MLKSGLDRYAERRGVDLAARVADLDARLQRLATQVEPDPGLPSRVAALAQLRPGLLWTTSVVGVTGRSSAPSAGRRR